VFARAPVCFFVSVTCFSSYRLYVSNLREADKVALGVVLDLRVGTVENGVDGVGAAACALKAVPAVVVGRRDVVADTQHTSRFIRVDRIKLREKKTINNTSRVNPGLRPH